MGHNDFTGCYQWCMETTFYHIFQMFTPGFCYEIVWIKGHWYQYWDECKSIPTFHKECFTDLKKARVNIEEKMKECGVTTHFPSMDIAYFLYICPRVEFGLSVTL